MRTCAGLDNVCCCGWEVAGDKTHVSHCKTCHAAEETFFEARKDDADFWLRVWGISVAARRGTAPKPGR